MGLDDLIAALIKLKEHPRVDNNTDVYVVAENHYLVEHISVDSDGDVIIDVYGD